MKCSRYKEECRMKKFCCLRFLLFKNLRSSAFICVKLENGRPDGWPFISIIARGGRIPALRELQRCNKNSFRQSGCYLFGQSSRRNLLNRCCSPTHTCLHWSAKKP